MPLYVYACPRGGARFERLVPLSRADEAPACPACGTFARRTITAAATADASRSAAAAASAPRPGIT